MDDVFVTCSELRWPVFKAIISFQPNHRLQFSVAVLESIHIYRNLSWSKCLALNGSDSKNNVVKEDQSKVIGVSARI